jgi:hypothetical protein
MRSGFGDSRLVQRAYLRPAGLPLVTLKATQLELRLANSSGPQPVTPWERLWAKPGETLTVLLWERPRVKPLGQPWARLSEQPWAMRLWEQPTAKLEEIGRLQVQMLRQPCRRRSATMDEA